MVEVEGYQKNPRLSKLQLLQIWVGRMEREGGGKREDGWYFNMARGLRQQYSVGCKFVQYSLLEVLFPSPLIFVQEVVLCILITKDTMVRHVSGNP